MKIKEKFKIKNKRLFINHDLLPFLILIAICFLGVGYGALNKTLEITGTISAKVQEGVFISNVSYNSTESENVDTSLNSYVISETLLHSNIVLSETDTTSKITYDITIFNNNDYAVYFDEIISETNNPEGANNNDNIIYEVSRLNEDNEYVSLEQEDIISSKDTMYVRITFSYNSTIDTTQNDYNKLSSYINFKFYQHYVENPTFNYNFNNIETDENGDLVMIDQVNGESLVITGATYENGVLTFDGNALGSFPESSKDLFKNSVTFEFIVKFDSSDKLGRDLLAGNYWGDKTDVQNHSIGMERYESDYRLWFNQGKIDIRFGQVKFDEIVKITFVFDKENSKFIFYENGNLIYSIVSEEIANYDYDWSDAKLGGDNRHLIGDTRQVLFNGNLYGLYIYEKALTEEEVYQNYIADYYNLISNLN